MDQEDRRAAWERILSADKASQDFYFSALRSAEVNALKEMLCELLEQLGMSRTDSLKVFEARKAAHMASTLEKLETLNPELAARHDLRSLAFVSTGEAIPPLTLPRIQ